MSLSVGLKAKAKFILYHFLFLNNSFIIKIEFCLDFLCKRVEKIHILKIINYYYSSIFDSLNSFLKGLYLNNKKEGTYFVIVYVVQYPPLRLLFQKYKYLADCTGL